jgi:hypothetical protein
MRFSILSERRRSDMNNSFEKKTGFDANVL